MNYVDVERHRDLPTEPGEHPAAGRIRTTIQISFPERAEMGALYEQLWDAYYRACDEIEDFFQEADAA